MLPTAIVIGVSLHQSIHQLQQFSQSHRQSQANSMADFFAAQIQSHLSQQKQNIDEAVKQHNVADLMRKKQYSSAKKKLQSTLGDDEKLFLVPNKGQGLSPKSLPPHVIHALKSHAESRLVIGENNSSAKTYFVVNPVINKGLLGYVVLQRNIEQLFSLIKAGTHYDIALYADAIPINNEDLLANKKNILGKTEVSQSNWSIVVNWKSTRNSAKQLFLPLFIIFFAIFIAFLLSFYGFYKIAMKNIGKDLSTLRQIVRDMRQGSVKDFYENRLLEFRAAFGTFQRIAKEVSEDHGFMSSKGRDPLTGLPNRESLDDHLGRLLMNLYENKKGFTIFILEINEIDDIADSYGYHCRDAVMAKIASDLKTALRKSDHIARLDENLFAIIFTDTSEKLVDRLERRLNKYLSQFVDLADDLKVRITWSSGYCIANDSNLSLDDVYNRAIESLAMAHSQRVQTSNTAASVRVSSD